MVSVLSLLKRLTRMPCNVSRVTDLPAERGIRIHDKTARIHQHHAARHQFKQSLIQLLALRLGDQAGMDLAGRMRIRLRPTGFS